MIILKLGKKQRKGTLGSAEGCRSKDQQGAIGGFLPPEDDSDISF